MNYRIVIYGSSGLDAKASEKLPANGAGKDDFTGVSVGGLFVALTRDDIRKIPTTLSLCHSKTGRKFEVSGFCSQSFVQETMNCSEGHGIVRIAGVEMRFRKEPGKKLPPHEYVVEIELPEGIKEAV